MNPRMCKTALATLAAFLVASALTAASAKAETMDGVEGRHGVAMHGDVKYPPDFQHFDYVNPDAPQGGTMRLAAEGNYDNLNPYTVRGVAAQGGNLMFETLTASPNDEPFTVYGRIAETIYMPEDRSWVGFKLRENARWHDGEPITVDDVIFSLGKLREEGHPFYRFYYSDVADVRKVGTREVRFEFGDTTNRELPLIVGQMPVLPKHYWEDRDFGRATLDPPLGSGPYRIGRHEPGRFVEYLRVEDYWGDDLAVNRGRWNFERIRYDYFRDPTVIREAVKSGTIDFRLENQAKAWASDYDVPAVDRGALILDEIDHDTPTGMQGFVMNTRRDIFSDARVRKAMAYAFDFEWTNRNLFFGQYDRTTSYFSNSELASSGLPEGREREILEQFEDRIPERVFTEPYEPPSTDGTGYPRENLKRALELLEEAGWVVEDMTLVNEETGRPFRFEVLLVSRAFERIVLPLAANLRKLGIDVDVRLVDSSQYQRRIDSFDFDVIINVWGQSLSPGNEQREYWGSESAERQGSRNYAGLQDPVVDELVDMLIQAPDREELVHRVRALDRVLLSHHLVIPNWHIGYHRVAYWDKFGRPEINPPYGLPYLDAWWYERALPPDLSGTVAAADGGARRDGGGVPLQAALTVMGFLALVALAWFFFRRNRTPHSR